MKCHQFHESIIDLATADPGPGELQDHLRACTSCSAELKSLRETMSLLDEWQAPADTNPYFMTRLRARIREEEQARPAAGWLAWFRKPVLAVSMMVLMVISIGLFQGSWHVQDNRKNGGSENKTATLKPGTPVGDLQYLEKNHDLLADFDMLDELENPSSTTRQ